MMPASNTTRHNCRPVSLRLTRRLVTLTVACPTEQKQLAHTGIARGLVVVWSTQHCRVTYLCVAECSRSSWLLRHL